MVIGNSPNRGLALSLLGSLASRPTSKSEWESRFSFWQKPASDTEEAKIDAATKRVKLALGKCEFLDSHDWEIIPQGSYHNNTNVRSDSDVDLAVCLTNTYFFVGPNWEVISKEEVGLVPLTFTFRDFKREIEQSLISEFGDSEVHRGNNAIHLNKDADKKISVDVVPTFTFREYGSLNPGSLRQVARQGIGLDTEADERKTNFPRQHYALGCAKNERTSRRFKRVVRILKRMRNSMADDMSVGPAVRAQMASMPSYLIESLVYNCPDVLFGEASIYDDVVNVLRYLALQTNRNVPLSSLKTSGTSVWTEVNGIKFLFHSSQKWTQDDAFDFSWQALEYMGL